MASTVTVLRVLFVALFIVLLLRWRRMIRSGEVKSVVFIHPDLGIGGAERLVIDAARGLKLFHKKNVCIITSSHDKCRSFSDITIRTNPKDAFLDADSPQEKSYPNVLVRGSSFPRSLRGRGVRLCRYLCMIYVTLWIVLCGPVGDAFVVDQVPFLLVVLRLLLGKNVPLVFYCHFPDFLCSPTSKTARKTNLSLCSSAYSYIFNAVERFSMRFATIVLYNSNFTKAVSEKHLRMEDFPGRVLYPPVYPECFEQPSSLSTDDTYTKEFAHVPFTLQHLPNDALLIVSISRFEPKKTPILALETFQLIESHLNSSISGLPPVCIILAGGYDRRLKDNCSCMSVIHEWLAIKPDMAERVSILPNISDAFKWRLLNRADVVLYTPENEHFGIVPVEAMLCGKPVVGSRSGGLLETVGETRECGILVQANAVEFADALLELLYDSDKRNKMGLNGQWRARKSFSLTECAKGLNEAIFRV